MQYATRTLLLIMLATALGVLGFRFYGKGFTEHLPQILAIACGCTLGATIYFLASVFQGAYSKIGLIALVVIVSFIFARDFSWYVLGLFVGVIATWLGTPVLNFVFRMLGVNERIRKKPNTL